MTGPRHDSVIAQVAMAAPSVTAALTYFDRISVQDWLAVSGILFIGFQGLYLAWKWRRDARREQDRLEDRAAARESLFGHEDTET